MVNSLSEQILKVFDDFFYDNPLEKRFIILWLQFKK